MRLPPPSRFCPTIICVKLMTQQTSPASQPTILAVQSESFVAAMKSLPAQSKRSSTLNPPHLISLCEKKKPWADSKSCYNPLTRSSAERQWLPWNREFEGLSSNTCRKDRLQN